MDDILTAVKTARQDTGFSLTPVSTLSENVSSKRHFDLDNLSAHHIIDLLKSKPDHDQLFAALTTLDPFSKHRATNDFDLRISNITTTQIVRLLVSTTIPHHWRSLDASKGKDAKARAALLRCLSNMTGLSLLVSELRVLINSVRASAHKVESSSTPLIIEDLLAVLSALLEPKDFLLCILTDHSAVCDNKAQQQIMWKELVSLVAGGKLLSTAAEALTVVDESNVQSSTTWVGTGNQYVSWLGRNISHMALKLAPNNKIDQIDWVSVTLLTTRALHLGYTDQMVKEIYSGLIFEQSSAVSFGLLLDNLRKDDQLSVLEAIFRHVQRNHFSDDLSGSVDQSTTSLETVKGVAALCSLLISKRPELETHVLEWLSKSQGGSISTLGLRRALLASFSNRADLLKELVMRSLGEFGDKFSITHVSIVVQNAIAQVILLAVGHLKRLDSAQAMEVGRSGAYLNAVSNRLAASSNRARLLGMIIGTGISELIEEAGKVLKFDLEEMQSEEVKMYLNLTKLKDECGSPESLKSLREAPPKPIHAKRTPKPKTQFSLSQTSKIVAIEEVEDSDEEKFADEDDDDDLIPYEKPDDDAYDSDDDPTLIQRTKPTAPVYIRDLIVGLRDTENIERHHLAITTAPSLIRRKIGFGTELADNIEELALTMVGLQNDNNHPQFHEARLQSMIALLVSEPLKMGRWFTGIYFDGDISQVQRSAVLTALGLSARELAGNGEDDAKRLNLPSTGDTSFPSKRLPAAVEAMYLGQKESPIAMLTREMSRTSLEPLAANAADAMSGPDALKVRTFSSRMEVEKKRQQRETKRKNATAKDLHEVLAKGFFFPMQGRFEIMMLQFSSSTSPTYNPFFIPHLLTLFLQTLSLILSTTGPHTPLLPGLTHETLSLLIAVHRMAASNEPTVTAAILSLFLAIVDLNIESGSNGEERLITQYAKEMIELREWASQVFDRTPAEAARADPTSAVTDPQEQVRTLSAGIMVRLGEITERYQGRLMGVGAGFNY